MGHAIAVRTDYAAGEIRRFAQRAKDAAQARRLLAIAAVLDGASREEAAKIGGMDRQTLRDWVIRFNEQGADGLINIPSPGMPPKLNAAHKAFLVRIVEEGPIAAIHGVVRWRACDLIMRLHEEFGLSVSDDTIYRALKNLGFSHVSARPKACKQSAEAMDASCATDTRLPHRRALLRIFVVRCGLPSSRHRVVSVRPTRRSFQRGLLADPLIQIPVFRPINRFPRRNRRCRLAVRVRGCRPRRDR